MAKALLDSAASALGLLLLAIPAAGQSTLWDDVERGYAENGDVRIHYATVGEGPLVVMIHGFPDFWYSWREQMEGLKSDFQVAAIDQRGYNRSSQPDGIEAYDMSLLVEDVVAVVRHLGRDRATIVGHDWGGVVAWNVAFSHPDLVENLVILDLPHPTSMQRAWRDNPEALAATEYARVFRAGTPDDPQVFFGMPMTPQTLSGWVRDPDARAKYVEAFERSSFDGMLAYYKRNYPDLWSDEGSAGALAPPDVPQVQAPTLVFHGLEDQALHSDGLNNTWDWIDGDLTLVTVPDAGHFVQQDAPELVTETMLWWLKMRR
ncbi:MAG: alpha/beta hydrolase [Gemmatimonadetes bacterium]|nr:alpha/beta hydrolase [Gemmatimonadota bacterium]